MLIETKDGIKEMTAALIIGRYDATGWLVCDPVGSSGVKGWSAGIEGILADLAGMEWELEDDIEVDELADAICWDKEALNAFLLGYWGWTKERFDQAFRSYYDLGKDIGKKVRQWVSTEF